MMRRWMSWFVGVSSLLVSPSLGAEELSSDALIDLVVSRSTAFYSGVIEWEYEAKSEGDALPKSSEDRWSFSVGMRGAEWSLRYPGSENFQICRNDMMLSYSSIEDTQRKRVDRSLVLGAPQTLPEWISSNEFGSVLRGGSLPWEEQVMFMDARRNEVRRLPSETVRGYACEVLEWTAKRTDYDEAFILIPADLGAETEGLLRVYVSPALQGAVVRVEYRTKQGKLVADRNDDRFAEVGDQIHFPMQVTQRYLTEGKWEEHLYQVLRVAHVNQKLPNDVFDVQVPVGTRVRDERPGMPRVGFDIKRPEQVQSIRQLLDPESVTRRPIAWRRILMGINGFLFVTLLIYWRTSRWRAP